MENLVATELLPATLELIEFYIKNPKSFPKHNNLFFIDHIQTLAKDLAEFSEGEKLIQEAINCPQKDKILEEFIEQLRAEKLFILEELRDAKDNLRKVLEEEESLKICSNGHALKNQTNSTTPMIKCSLEIITTEEKAKTLMKIASDFVQSE